MQQQAFDSYAKTYDVHFTYSLIGKMQRRQVYRHANNSACLYNKNILEINCGTGEDALWLAKQNSTVLATDISKAMLDLAKSKSLGFNIEFKQIEAQEIEQLIPKKFQSIFSNFGGLNCLSPEQLEKFSSGCSALQEQGNYIVLVIMGTNCLWERLYFKFIGKTEKSNRRKQTKGVGTIIQSQYFKTYYYSPEQIKKLFQKDYHHINTKPIGFFVPPSYLETYFVKRKMLLKILGFLDWLLPFSILSNYADHYIILFQKK